LAARDETEEHTSLIDAVANLVWNPILTGTFAFSILVLGLYEPGDSFSFSLGEFAALGAVALGSIAIGTAISRFWTTGSNVVFAFGFLTLIADLFMYPLFRVLALLGVMVRAALSISGTEKAADTLMALGVLLGGFGYFAGYQNERRPGRETGEEVSSRAAEVVIAAGWFIGIIGGELFVLAQLSGPVFGVPLP
jgi:hypothetical protein